MYKETVTLKLPASDYTSIQIAYQSHLKCYIAHQVDGCSTLNICIRTLIVH